MINRPQSNTKNRLGRWDSRRKPRNSKLLNNQRSSWIGTGSRIAFHSSFDRCPFLQFGTTRNKSLASDCDPTCDDDYAKDRTFERSISSRRRRSGSSGESRSKPDESSKRCLQWKPNPLWGSSPLSEYDAYESAENETLSPFPSNKKWRKLSNHPGRLSLKASTVRSGAPLTVTPAVVSDRRKSKGPANVSSHPTTGTPKRIQPSFTSTRSFSRYSSTDTQKRHQPSITSARSLSRSSSTDTPKRHQHSLTSTESLSRSSSFSTASNVPSSSVTPKKSNNNTLKSHDSELEICKSLSRVVEKDDQKQAVNNSKPNNFQNSQKQTSKHHCSTPQWQKPCYHSHWKPWCCHGMTCAAYNQCNRWSQFARDSCKPQMDYMMVYPGSRCVGGGGVGGGYCWMPHFPVNPPFLCASHSWQRCQNCGGVLRCRHCQKRREDEEDEETGEEKKDKKLKKCTKKSKKRNKISESSEHTSDTDSRTESDQSDFESQDRYRYCKNKNDYKSGNKLKSKRCDCACRCNDRDQVNCNRDECICNGNKKSKDENDIWECFCGRGNKDDESKKKKKRRTRATNGNKRKSAIEQKRMGCECAPEITKSKCDCKSAIGKERSSRNNKTKCLCESDSNSTTDDDDHQCQCEHCRAQHEESDRLEEDDSDCDCYCISGVVSDSDIESMHSKGSQRRLLSLSRCVSNESNEPRKDLSRCVSKECNESRRECVKCDEETQTIKKKPKKKLVKPKRNCSCDMNVLTDLAMLQNNLYNRNCNSQLYVRRAYPCKNNFNPCSSFMYCRPY